MTHAMRLGALLAALAALSVTAFACGDDDDASDDGTAESTTPTSTAAQTPTGSASPTEPGDAAMTTGTFSLNGETLTFNVAFCGFTTEETGSDTIPFALVGAGTLAEGGPFAINAAILDVSGQAEELGEVHVIEVYDETTLEVLYTSAHAPDDDEFAIDGTRVAMTAEFASGSDDNEIIGNGDFEAECPA